MSYGDPTSDPQNVPGSVPPPVPGSPFAPGPADVPVRTSGLAVASFVLGLLSCALSFLAGIPAAILGIVALVKIGGSGGRLGGKGMAITGLVLGIIDSVVIPGILIAILLPAIQQVRETGRRIESTSNMREIGLATLSFESAMQRFPAAGANERGEGPNLSWRVQILPYIDQRDLYDRFHRDEPWDSEHNRALIERMPEIYQCPSVDLEAGKTVYLAVTGPDTIFPGGRRGLSMNDVARQDGPAYTIMLVEGDPDQAVIWTKPDDWEFDPGNPRRGLGSLRRGGFLALFADGHTLNIADEVSDETLRRLFMVNDGQPIDEAELNP